MSLLIVRRVRMRPTATLLLIIRHDTLPDLH
jgi:hypothetical protein